MGISLGSLVGTASQALNRKRELQREEEERASQQEMAVLQRALLQAQIDKMNAPATPERPIAVSPDAGLYDPTTRTFIREPGQGKPPEPKISFREGVGPDGKPAVFGVDERTLSARPVSGMSPAPSSVGGQIAGQRTVLARMAQDALNAMTDPTTGKSRQTAPTVGEQIAQRIPWGLGQGLLSEERQLQNQAGDQFTEAALRFTTGAQAPEHEKQQYIAMLTLRAGDKPALRERKLRAQQTLLNSLLAITQRGDVDPNEAFALLQEAALGTGQGPLGSAAPGPQAQAPQSGGGEFDEFLQ